jgi:hypothetical protein
MVVKKFISVFMVAVSLVSYCGFTGAQNMSQNSTLGPSASQDPCAAMKLHEEQEDCKRNTARVYTFGAVKSIHIGGSQYYDVDGKACTSHRGRKLTKARVRYFLDNSVPISQIAFMNYYGDHGECTSQNVLVVFKNGRSMHISFSAISNTAYVSPLAEGQEVDVYFYYCEKCVR